MLQGHPQSAGLYNAAGTPSVSRVVQCCRDTLSQQGCTMLQGTPLPSAALSTLGQQGCTCCMDTLSQQGCTMLLGLPDPAGLYDAAGLD